MRDEKKKFHKKKSFFIISLSSTIPINNFSSSVTCLGSFSGLSVFFFCAGTKRGREIKWEMIKGKILFCWIGWRGEENGKAICARSRDDVLHLSGVWRCFDDNF